MCNYSEIGVLLHVGSVCAVSLLVRDCILMVVPTESTSLFNIVLELPFKYVIIVIDGDYAV